jgi:hypothetical protein
MYLGIVRQIDTSVSFKESVEFVKERNLESTYVSIGTIELAGSFRTTNLVVDYIPKYHDHFYGRFFLKNMRKSLPKKLIRIKRRSLRQPKESKRKVIRAVLHISLSWIKREMSLCRPRQSVTGGAVG